MSARRLLGLTRMFVVVATVGTGTAAADPADPQAHILSPADGQQYPQGATVQFAFYCSSETSFVISCAGSQDLGSELDTVQAGSHTVTVTATDYDGRHSTATSTYTVIDITPPHVEFGTPADGASYEMGADLHYDYACADDPGGLGILECFSPMPLGYPIDTHRSGTFTFDVYAVDLAFHITHETATYTITDRKPPAIAFTSPADGASYIVGHPVWTSFFCDDGPDGSGLKSCDGDQPSNTPLDTSTLGPKTFTVTASDRAGNVASETHSYSIVYDFAGFASPAESYPTATSTKAGESVPLKFSLHGDQGSSIFAAGSPGWAPCGALDGPTWAAGTLSYNASNDRYTYLAPTSKSWAGGCRDLIATFRDGTTHRARFTFTK